MQSKETLASLLLLFAVKSSAVDKQRMTSISTSTIRKRQRHHTQQQVQAEGRASFGHSFTSNNKITLEQNSEPYNDHIQNQGSNNEFSQVDNNGDGNGASSNSPSALDSGNVCQMPSCDANDFKSGNSDFAIYIKFAYEVETDPSIVNAPIKEKVIPNLECAMESVVRKSLGGKCKGGCPRRLEEDIETIPQRKLEVVSVSPCPLDKLTKDEICQKPKAKESNVCNAIQGGMTISVIGENKEILENQVIYALQSAMYNDKLLGVAEGIVRVSYVRTAFWGSAPQEHDSGFAIGAPSPAPKKPNTLADRDIPVIRSTQRTSYGSVWIGVAFVVFLCAFSICAAVFGRKRDDDKDIVDSILLEEGKTEI